MFKLNTKEQLIDLKILAILVTTVIGMIIIFALAVITVGIIFTAEQLNLIIFIGLMVLLVVITTLMAIQLSKSMNRYLIRTLILKYSK